MDHQEEHHLHHRKEREHEKQLRKAHEHEQEKKDTLPFHPAWLLAVGIALTAGAILVWTLLL